MVTLHISNNCIHHGKHIDSNEHQEYPIVCPNYIPIARIDMYTEIEIKWNNMVFFCSLNLRAGLIFFCMLFLAELQYGCGNCFISER